MQRLKLRKQKKRSVKDGDREETPNSILKQDKEEASEGNNGSLSRRQYSQNNSK